MICTCGSDKLILGSSKKSNISHLCIWISFSFGWFDNLAIKYQQFCISFLSPIIQLWANIRFKNTHLNPTSISVKMKDLNNILIGISWQKHFDQIHRHDVNRMMIRNHRWQPWRLAIRETLWIGVCHNCHDCQNCLITNPWSIAIDDKTSIAIAKDSHVVLWWADNNNILVLNKFFLHFCQHQF